MQLLTRFLPRAALLAVLVLAAACATVEPVNARHHTASPPAAPPVSPQDVKFDKFIADFRAVAAEAGITPATYDAAMTGLKRDDKIEALTEAQPEFVKPVWEYLDTAASPRRVSDGRTAMASQAAALATIEAKYGVPKEILVSIWGNETDFGTDRSAASTSSTALATLAYDGPRANFGQLNCSRAEDDAAGEAGPEADGVVLGRRLRADCRCFPRPSSKAHVDGDGDGKRDLWHSAPDALASAAVEVSNDRLAARPCLGLRDKAAGEFRL
jgi:membrane-bound lytic murein transglycosylase B